jgi:hypothetical protein
MNAMVTSCTVLGMKFPQQQVTFFVSRVTHSRVPAASLAIGEIHKRSSNQVSSVSGKSSPFSDSASWDTDFSDDEDTSKVSDLGWKKRLKWTLESTTSV